MHHSGLRVGAIGASCCLCQKNEVHSSIYSLVQIKLSSDPDLSEAVKYTAAEFMSVSCNNCNIFVWKSWLLIPCDSSTGRVVVNLHSRLSLSMIDAKALIGIPVQKGRGGDGSDKRPWTRCNEEEEEAGLGSLKCDKTIEFWKERPSSPFLTHFGMIQKLPNSSGQSCALKTVRQTFLARVNKREYARQYPCKVSNNRRRRCRCSFDQYCFHDWTSERGIFHRR
jgi:hypothetical protein